jgi:hypothetical protein
MPFPCPACRAPIDRSPADWGLRCPSCGAVLESRAVEGGRLPHPAYDVEVRGRPETRVRVEVPWDDAQRRRLREWLLWSSVLTLGLVVVLFLAAWLAR